MLAGLRRSFLLADLPEETLQWLSSAGTMVGLSRGEVLLQQGQPADAMYMVVSGAVEVFAEVAGETVPLAVSRPGDALGEMALIAGRARSASARALEDVEVMRIDAAAFARLLEFPKFTHRLLIEASERLEQRQLLTLQHTKMAALGQLTAGLLHELNNPTAALRRHAQVLQTRLEELRTTGAQLQPAAAAVALRITAAARPDAAPADALDRSDAEQRMQRWMSEHGVAEPWELAPVLVARGLSPELLDALMAAEDETGPVDPVLRAASAALDADMLLEALLVAAQRIGQTVAAVSAYSHHGEAPVQDVVLTDGIERALDLLAHKVGAGVAIMRDYGVTLPEVEGHPGDLNSVWTNLLDNALDAVGKAGTITVRARREDGRVVVEVIDDGPGITPDVQARIFDPFFTTKPVGQGTGVGLALARSIVVQRHGGELSVDSVPGRTVFRVALPLRQAGEAGGGGPGGEPEPADHSGVGLP